MYFIEENSLYCVDLGGRRIIKKLTMEGLEGGVIYGDELLYSRSSGWADTQTDLYVVNLKTEHLIILHSSNSERTAVNYLVQDK